MILDKKMKTMVGLPDVDRDFFDIVIFGKEIH